MSSEWKAIWWMPSPFFSMNLAIGLSGEVASSNSMWTPPTLKKDFRRYLYVMLSCISKDRYLKGCFRKASAEKIIIHSSGNSKKMTLDDVAIFYMKCDLASNLLNNYECKKSVMRTVFKQLLQSNCLHIIPFNKYYIEMTHLVLEHIPQYNDQMIFLDDLLHYYLNTNQN